MRVGREGMREEREGMHGQREGMREEREGMRDGRNGMHEERQGMREEREGMYKEREGMHEESERMREEREGMHEGREGMHEGRDGMHDGGGNTWGEGREGMREEREGMHEGREGMREEREGMREGREGMREGREGMREEREGMREEREGMREGREGMREEREGMREGREGMREGREGMREGSQQVVSTEEAKTTRLSRRRTKSQIMPLQLLSAILFLSVVAAGDDTLYLRPRHSNVVICPDQKGTCPDGSTCCLLNTDQYGCCPLQKAVCCNDHIHCCPSGMICDVATSTCTKGAFSVPWQKKTLALKAGVNVQKAQHSLPWRGVLPRRFDMLHDGIRGIWMLSYAQADVNESTVMYQVTDMFPSYNEAVCCSDHIHCCPSGTICDVATSTCTKGAFSVPWQKKTLALKAGVNVQKANIVCPGGESCPDESTCCLMKSGEYGCCPLPKAVCCKDGQHCCPNGYTCDSICAMCIASGGNRVPNAAARLIAAVEGRYSVKN
ncbi:hypothetical protein LSAT2_028590 [Lamellibrachia satsuma]|nr:hypothetical protein LSAT2_028590 [Lamellibrachia satsuma]